MAQEGGRLTNTEDLLFKVKDSFHSSVDPSSLVKAMVDKKLLKKKEKKFLDISDETTVSSYIYSKLSRSDSRFMMTSQEFIDLVRATEHKKNLNFADHLQTLFDESEKQFMETEKLKAVMEGQTVLTAENPSMDEPLHEKTVKEQSTSGSTFIHTDPDEPASAVFTSEGGILYSPYHGVTVYILKGAIPEGQNVRVSFWPVTEEASRAELLSHPSFPTTAILIGPVFEFVSKYADSNKDFDTFLDDVWISLPICASPSPDNTKQSNASFAVYSENNGELRRDRWAVFGYDYPYVNIPVRHFCRKAPVHDAFPPPRRGRRKSKYVDDLIESGKMGSPILDTPNIIRQVSNSPTTKRALYREAKKVSNEARTSQESVDPRSKVCDDLDEPKIGIEHNNSDHQCSVDRQLSVGTQEAVLKAYDDLDQPEMMEIEHNSSGRQEDYFSLPSLALCVLLLQPKNRNRKKKWKAKLHLLAHTQKSLSQMSILVARYGDQFEFQFCGFNWKSNLDYACFSHNPATSEGWGVSLDREEIFILDVLQAMEFHDMLVVSNLLPMSEATVLNRGAVEGLHHGVTVVDSVPPATCYLTCDVLTEADKETCRCPTGPVSTSIEWDKDRLLIAVLSIVIPRNQLKALLHHFHCEEIVADQIQSANPNNFVGEQIYSAFCTAHMQGKLPSFGIILSFLERHPNYKAYLDLTRAYLTQFKSNPSIKTLEGSEYSMDFLKWVVAERGMVHCGSIPSSPLSDEEQRILFRELSLKIVLVWKMFARLFGLDDSTINSIAVHYTPQMPEDVSYQMLLRLALVVPSISYSHILSVLQVISFDAGAPIFDALSFIEKQCFLVH